MPLNRKQMEEAGSHRQGDQDGEDQRFIRPPRIISIARILLWTILRDFNSRQTFGKPMGIVSHSDRLKGEEEAGIS